MTPLELFACMVGAGVVQAVIDRLFGRGQRAKTRPTVVERVKVVAVFPPGRGELKEYGDVPGWMWAKADEN